MRELPDDFYDHVTAPPVTKLASQLNSRIYIPRWEFCNEVADFFDVWGKGKFSEQVSPKNTDKLFLNPDGLSYILKRLVNLLPTPEELIVSILEEDGKVCLKFLLDTSGIQNLLYHELCQLAAKSGFGFIMKPDCVILTSEIIECETLEVYAGKVRLVYAALKDIFMNPIFKR